MFIVIFNARYILDKFVDMQHRLNIVLRHWNLRPSSLLKNHRFASFRQVVVYEIQVARRMRGRRQAARTGGLVDPRRTCARYGARVEIHLRVFFCLLPSPSSLFFHTERVYERWAHI